MNSSTPIQPSLSGLTIGLIEPEELAQYALTMLIRSQPDMNVVGVADDADTGLRMLTEKRPRVAVIEIDLEARSGFDLANDLAMRQRETRVIFCSKVMPDIYIEQAVRSKAAGYLLRDDSMSNMLAAIKEVGNGGTYFSPAIREKISTDGATGAPRASFEGRLSKLSDRQIEVLRNLAFGMSVKDVARKMHISVKSVDSHKYRIMQSLGIHDRVALARFAIREGLVSV
jgi:DNA-binding NarL/FixJ family response regulator